MSPLSFVGDRHACVATVIAGSVLALLFGAAGGCASTVAGTGDSGVTDAFPGCDTLSAPRLLAPLSTSWTTARRPSLRLVPSAGMPHAHVDLCHDRACTQRFQRLAIAGDRAVLTADLAPGMVYWRAVTEVPGCVPQVSATWEFRVSVMPRDAGVTWGSTADVNGDGYSDAMVVVDGPRVYFGSAAGLAASRYVRLAGGNEPVSAVDVNGDGYGDVVGGPVGTGWSLPEFVVHFGGPQGPSDANTQVVQLPDGLRPPEPFTQPNLEFNGVGDLDGDGYGDVAVTGSAAQTVWVYRGSAHGLSMSPAWTVGIPGTIGDPSGTPAIADPGDWNGDGASDLLVGAYTPLPFTAHAYVFSGGATLSTTPTWVMEGVPDPAGGVKPIGTVALLGDADGDGHADLALAEGFDRARIFPGPGVTSAAVDPVFTGELTCLAAAGDVDGDGFADVLTTDYTMARATVYFGGSRSVWFQRTQALTGPDLGFGYALVGNVDFNGDGFADVLIDDSPPGLSTVRVYYGSPVGLIERPSEAFVNADLGFT